MSPSGCLSVLALRQTGGLSRVYTASCTMVAGMDGCTLNAYGSNPVSIAFNICLLIECPRKRIQEKQIMSGSCQHFQIKRLILESVQKKAQSNFWSWTRTHCICYWSSEFSPGETHWHTSTHTQFSLNTHNRLLTAHSVHLLLFSHNSSAERRPSWMAVKCWYQWKKNTSSSLCQAPRQPLFCIVWKAMIVKRSARMNNEKLHVHSILITFQY